MPKLSTTFDVGKISERIKESTKVAAFEVLEDLSFEIIKRTPVDTGFLRGNWLVRLNNPPDGSLRARGKPEARYQEGNRFPPVAQQTIGRVSSDLKSAELGDVVYFTNNAEYVAFVENGTASQTGARMVSSSIAILPNIAEETITRIKNLQGAISRGEI